MQRNQWTNLVLTVLEKYQALDISGTSGKTKKPAIAMGSDMTPSMMKSLHGVSMFLPYTEMFLTIATLSSRPYHQDDRQLPLSNLRTSFQWHCSCGKCNSFWRAHPFDTRTQLRTAFPGKKHFLLNRQGTERHIFGWQYYSERDTL